MASRWNEKRAKKAEFQMDKELEGGGNGVDLDVAMAKDVRGAAMGDGDEELFEKKLSKDEKKALAKAKRDAKKKAKQGSSSSSSCANTTNNKNGTREDEEKKEDQVVVFTTTDQNDKGSMTKKEERHALLLEELSKNDIVVTYEAKRGALHANTRDINASGVTVSFHGRPLIEETELVINYGNRYGFIGPNGSGKVRTFLERE